MEIFQLDISGLIKIFWLTATSFVLSIAFTPLFTDFLYKHKLGKRRRKTDLFDKSAPIFYRFHKEKEGTPTMGGLLVWGSVAVITFLFNLSRPQTYLPLFALVLSGIIGAIDDLLNIFGIGMHRGGLRFRHKLPIYLVIAGVGSWWFYQKLGWSAIHIPGGNLFGLPYNVELGLWYIPIFIIILVATSFAVNVTDGLDGLAGGTLAIAYSAYGIIALAMGKIYLAAFCGTIVGALLAFLWFNIYPARFFMGDTGSMALGMTLAVIAFLTNSVVVLPIIGFVFVLEGGSVILQILSKKFLGRKIFLSAPIHHHLEALGWPETKVTMRFWVIAAVLAAIGLMIGLIGRG